MGRVVFLLCILGGCGRLGFDDEDTLPDECMLAIDPGAPRLNFHSQRSIQSSGGTAPVTFTLSGSGTIDAAGVVSAGGDPGIATILAADAGGCTAEATLEIGGDTLWYVGGTSMSVPSPQVWRSTDGLAWTLAGTLPDKRTSGALLVFRDRLWWISGSDGVGPRDEVWSSDDGAIWTLAGHSPVAATNFGSVVFDNRMWMIGGSTGTDVKTVYASVDGDTWSMIGQLPDDSHGGSAIVAAGTMWYLGGHNRNTGTLKSWVLSSATGVTWQQTGTMMTGREYAAAIQAQDTIVLAGGQDLTPMQTSSVIAIMNGTTFAPQAALPVARAMGSLVLFDNRAWSIGGNDGGAVIVGTVPATSWTMQTTNFPVPRQGGRTAVFSPL